MGKPAMTGIASAVVCAVAAIGIAAAQDKAKTPAGKDAKSAPPAAAPAKSDKMAGGQHMTYNMSDLKWGDAPPGLPKGAKVAVLNGDPGQSGNFVVMAKFPSGYKVAPHWHSTDENVTIISGDLMMGTGDTADMKTAHAVKAGGYSYVPAKAHHWVVAKGETTIQIAGSGPFDITYVNASDDPRNAAPAAAPKKEEKKAKKM
jgi:quercetin dioxygenase-like cupin family protein